MPITSYDDFWPYYLAVHRQQATRLLHATGTTLAMVICLVLPVVTRNLNWVIAGFAVGYAFAWTSHALVERNRPAAFQRPVWSFFADLEMLNLMTLGWMRSELARVEATGGRTVSTARAAWRLTLRVLVFCWLGAMGVAWYQGWLSPGGH